MESTAPAVATTFRKIRDAALEAKTKYVSTERTKSTEYWAAFYISRGA